MLYYEIYETDIGEVFIAQDEDAITDLCMMEEGIDLTGAQRMETPLLKKAAEMLREYLAGKRDEFDGLPLNPKGTEFQKKVWRALLEIPYGETISYKQLAQAIDNPLAVRAVGGANGKNPIFIVIPCHRVIGADGSLAGFAYGTELKKKLLRIEKAECAPTHDQTSLFEC